VRTEIRIESPRGDEIEALLRVRNAHFAALYPGREGLEVTSASLADPDVRFFAVRLAGGLVGCGALIVRTDYGELKRFFLRKEARGQGLGARLLGVIEDEARRLGIKVIRLEVGVRQTEAFNLYMRAGYTPIDPFGTYVGDPLSRYLEKTLD
jgi:putative acetyltransferase